MSTSPLRLILLFVATFCLFTTQPASATSFGVGELIIWPPSGLLISTPQFFAKGSGLAYVPFAESLSDGELVLEASDAGSEPHLVPLVIVNRQKLGGLTYDSAGAVLLEMRPSAPLIPNRSYVLRGNPKQGSKDQHIFEIHPSFGEYQVISAKQDVEDSSSEPAPLRFIQENVRLTHNGVQHSLRVEFDASGASGLVLMAKDSSGRVVLHLTRKNPPSAPTVMTLFRDSVGPCLFTDSSWSPVKTIEAIPFLAHGSKGEVQALKVNTNLISTSVMTSLARLQPLHPCSKPKGR